MPKRTAGGIDNGYRLTGDRGFESISLQRGVRRTFASLGLATSDTAPPTEGLCPPRFGHSAETVTAMGHRSCRFYECAPTPFFSAPWVTPSDLAAWPRSLTHDEECA